MTIKEIAIGTVAAIAVIISATLAKPVLGAMNDDVTARRSAQNALYAPEDAGSTPTYPDTAKPGTQAPPSPQSADSAQETASDTIDTPDTPDAEPSYDTEPSYGTETYLAGTVYAEPRIPVTEDEKELLAQIVYLEARGEPYDGQVAVVEVTINRVLDDRFPDDVEGVLSAPGQFATWKHRAKAKPSQTQYDAVNDALYGEQGEQQVLTPETVYFSRKALTKRVSARIGNHVFCE
jgi:spore germination cell wall hydrolase CwlJ-like protein